MKQALYCMILAFITMVNAYGTSYLCTVAAAPDLTWNNTANWTPNGTPTTVDPCQFPGYGNVNSVVPYCIIDGTHTGANKAVTLRANIGNQGAGPCTVLVDGGEFASATEIWLARNAADNYGILIISNGLVTVPLYTHVGQMGTGELHMVNGVMNNDGDLNIGATVNGVGYFTMTGGLITNVAVFNVGSLGGTGSALMEGGVLFADTLAMNGNIILTLEGTAKIVLVGDATTSVASFTNSNYLIAGSGRYIKYDYDSSITGHTTITTVPEPAIVVVLCIVGVLGIQRRR